MKFSTTTVLGLAAASPFGARAFQAVRPLSPAPSPTSLFSTTDKQGQKSSGMSKKKEERLSFMKSDQFHRRGFKEVRDQVESSIHEQYQSDLVNDLKTSNYVIERDGIKIYLAKVRKLVHSFARLEEWKMALYFTDFFSFAQSNFL